MISAGANSTAGVFPPGPPPCPTTSEPKSACRRAPSRTNPGSEAREVGRKPLCFLQKGKRQAGPPSGAAPPGCPYPGIPGGGQHLQEWRFDQRALGCGSPEINADQAGDGRLKVAKQHHFATLPRSVVPCPLFSGVWRAGGCGAGSKYGERYIRQLCGVLRRHGHPLRTRGSRPPAQQAGIPLAVVAGTQARSVGLLLTSVVLVSLLRLQRACVRCWPVGTTGARYTRVGTSSGCLW